MEQFDCMVGVSTKQNTTNLIPAIQYRPKSFLLVETHTARDQNWSVGLNKVLKKRGIDLQPPLQLSPQDDSRIDLIAPQLWERLKEVKRVAWNLGGGQKAQQLALWQTFTKRASQGYQDQACYPNADKHIIEGWQLAKGKLVYKQRTFENDITLTEVLQVFGRTMKSGELIWSCDQGLAAEQKLPDLLMFREFREYLFRLPAANLPQLEPDVHYTVEEMKSYLEKARPAIAQEVEQFFLRIYRNPGGCRNFNEASIQGYARRVAKIVVQNSEDLLLQKKRPSPQSIPIQDPQLQQYLADLWSSAPTCIEVNNDFLMKLCNCRKASEYFEKIMIQRITQWLCEVPHAVSEAYANVVVTSDEKHSDAEYDILLLTKWGTLISIDAKTFDFTKKDEDARLYNLQKAGGTYGTFMAVFPYHPDDIQQGYVPNELKTLPLRLDQRGSTFAVVADGYETSFNSPVKCKDETVKCLLWQQALQKLVSDTNST